MWERLPKRLSPDDAGGAGTATAATAAAPSPTPVAAPAPTAATPAPAPAATPSPGQAPTATPPVADKGADKSATKTDAKGDQKPAATDEGAKIYWPADWRETAAKGDEKRLNALRRYGSPEAALDALAAAQDRIRSGELAPRLGKNPTAEELKEWRESHGIPDAPNKYDLGEKAAKDDPVVAEFLKTAHDSNQTPEQVKATWSMWERIKTVVNEQRADQDLNLERDCEDVLRQEWGPEYRRNINIVHQLLDSTATPNLKDQFLGGRLADGTPIGSSAEAMRMLVSLALIKNPAGAIVPGSGANPEKGLREALETLQKIPAAKKTPEQDQKQRELISAAIQLKVMDAEGNWIGK